MPWRRVLPALAGLAAVMLSGVPRAAGQAAPGDHYFCYRAALAPGQPTFTRVQKNLEDQLEARVFDVKKIISLCNPAQENTEPPPAHPTVHQVGYQITAAKTPPQPQFTRSDHVAIDQFGSHPLTLVRPEGLLVPSAKTLGSGGTDTVDTTGVDHFECYKATSARGAPTFVPPPTTLADEFGTATYRLTKITKLCTPVNKNGEDPSAPDHPGHLVCYHATQAAGQFAPQTVSINNTNFGPAVLVARVAVELCVPAFKDSAPATTSTSTTSTSTSVSTSTSTSTTTSTTSTTTTSTTSSTSTSSTSTTNSTSTSSTTSTTEPSLMLTVSPLELRPAFSPSIHDYAVACSAGSNSLTLDAIAAPGGSVSLIAPFTTEPAASMTVTVQLNENAVAVVQATDASAVVEQYWIRCLPHDFPILSATRHPETGSPTPGWYLMGNPFVAQGSGSYAMIVDANGTPVWYHLHPGGAVAVEPFPDTTVAVAPVLGPGFGADPTRGFTLYHLDTRTREAVLTVGMPTDHHEILSLPNGDRMLLSYPLKTGVDLTGLRTYGPNSTIADCVVQEVDPADNLVWEWRASDHTDPVRESTAPSQVTVNGQPVVDVCHCNSIDVNAAGDVLVSARHLDSVFLISRATGTILWKLGGTAFNRDGAEILLILADPQIAFYRQHDARFQPNGDISLFDDHGAGSGPARGVEYELDLAGGTARLVWQYLGNATSSAMGSFRRYPDGDSVIGWGASTSSTHAAATEVDASGRDLLDLSFTSHGNWAYRAVKVPIDAFDINALRNTAGLP